MAKNISKKRISKRIRYAEYFNSWYMFAGLYLMRGRYLPGFNPSYPKTEAKTFAIIKNHFSSFISNGSLLKDNRDVNIPDEGFVHAFNHFSTLFFPFLNDGSIKSGKQKFYSFEKREELITKFIENGKYSVGKAEERMLKDYIESADDPLANPSFVEYLDNIKNRYLIWGDTNTREILLSAFKSLLLKGSRPKESRGWPLPLIFHHQRLFIEFEGTLKSKNEMETVLKDIDLNERDSDELLDALEDFRKYYYQCYHYFFKCLNIKTLKKKKTLLHQINIHLTRTHDPSLKVGLKKSDINYTNGIVLGYGSNQVMWSDIIAEKI